MSAQDSADRLGAPGPDSADRLGAPGPDSVDRHIAHWSRELSDLDPQIEGIVTRMQMLVRLLRRNKEGWLASSGLKPWEFEVLHHLVAAGPPYRVAPSLLAEWLDTHPATMTNRLDRMEQAGYITRAHDSGDRRRLLVALTAEGRAVWEERMEEGDRSERALLGTLGPAELGLLDGLLRRLVRGVEENGPPLMPEWPSGGRKPDGGPS
ncbi:MULTISPECIES: MarR family winged helix-turn-helix transcriptional regulator [Streptosporangium]|uniref:DNA-binding MarR family transcriptional regulator n=1 Tax=Streptosporangium brasiliense TaxID=47480 RepID=A0ABT9QZ43_9ACTN|nr:MarR family winged helix-turn-helix transcriptional regulator [Streptosporangium brasiliense]MDP9861470.1 DNA-binding MarR family transcriptional regulator [Streptosporangium brasiliense]